MRKIIILVLCVLTMLVVGCNSDLKKAREYQRQGDWVKAQEYYLKLVKNNPKNARYHNELGYVYMKRGFYELAEREYTQATVLDDFFVEAHYNKGTVLFKMGKFPEAIQEFEKVVKMDPNNAKAWNNLAMAVQVHENDYERALEFFRKAIKLDPENPDFHTNISNLYQAMGQNQLAEEHKNKAEALRARKK